MRALFYLPVLLAYQLTDRKAIITADADRWALIDRDDRRGRAAVLALFARKPEFRNLFYYRLIGANFASKIMRRLLQPIYRGESTLHIGADEIGPGLYIQHGFATIILAERLGANCWVNQQVTIGFKVTDGTVLSRPVLEDGVMVYAGAKIIGGVNVGENVTVGANAVVVKDVPANMTAIGVPAVARPHGRSARNAGG